MGCCNSGHDIAQDFYEKGYDVTMVQRSSTCVVSSESITKIALAGLYDENGPPCEDGDVWVHGTPGPVLKAIQIKVTELQAENDRETLEGLAKAGFKLDRGPDGAGLFMKYFQRGGGYYIDVGCSQLIVDGKIKIKQGQEIEEVLGNGLKFEDGAVLEADEVRPLSTPSAGVSFAKADRRDYRSFSPRGTSTCAVKRDSSSAMPWPIASAVRPVSFPPL